LDSLAGLVLDWFWACSGKEEWLWSGSALAGWTGSGLVLDWLEKNIDLQGHRCKDLHKILTIVQEPVARFFVITIIVIIVVIMIIFMMIKVIMIIVGILINLPSPAHHHRPALHHIFRSSSHISKCQMQLTGDRGKGWNTSKRARLPPAPEGMARLHLYLAWLRSY
jgi:hypothetical protein